MPCLQNKYTFWRQYITFGVFGVIMKHAPLTPSGYNYGMEEKRFTLRLPAELWRSLRVEAAKRDISVVKLINQWLQERLDAEEKQEE
jgi:hypothetical protein